MPPKDKYTDPKLRDQIKKEIQDGGKGGAPGQWSARKAQMMAAEYKKRGGSYTTDKENGQDESQKNLERWGEEDWQTKEGSGTAKTGKGEERKRYLPKKAWETMSEGEKEETEQKKIEGGKEGKQFVGNTGKAKGERKKVNEEEREEFEEKKQRGRKSGQQEQTQKGKNKKKQEEEDDEDDEDDEDAEDAEKEGADGDDAEDDDEEEEAQAGQKRKADKKQTNGTLQKKQKSNDGKAKKQGNAPPGKVGSKHMDATEPGPRGSSARLPKKGQEVTWKAMPGYIEGKVVEVVTGNEKVEGKDIKASKSDPRLVLKSTSSGKICVHKPDACFYE